MRNEQLRKAFGDLSDAALAGLAGATPEQKERIEQFILTTMYPMHAAQPTLVIAKPAPAPVGEVVVGEGDTVGWTVVHWFDKCPAVGTFLYTSSEGAAQPSPQPESAEPLTLTDEQCDAVMRAIYAAGPAVTMKAARAIIREAALATKPQADLTDEQLDSLRQLSVWAEARDLSGEVYRNRARGGASNRWRCYVDALEALRIFVGCATPVSTEIDRRGYSWSEAYLDEALLRANAVLSARAQGVADLTNALTALRWCVENDGECLGDHRKRLEYYRAIIAAGTAS